MRSRLGALAAALVLASAGVAGEPVPPGTDETRQISFEVRVLTLPESFFERIGVDFEAAGGVNATAQAPVFPEGGVLPDSQIRKLLEAAQGDPRANVMMAPKVTALDGQDAAIQATQRQVYTTGVDAVRVTGQTVLVPRNTAVDVGMSMNLNGRVAADGKSIVAQVRFRNTEVGGVEMIPVMTQVMPVTADGKKMKDGKPIPFTQYIQSPQIDTETIEKKDLAIPAGGHAVLVGPSRVREARQEFGPPMLAKIPYINRLYKNVGVGRESVRTVLIVSPRVLAPK